MLDFLRQIAIVDQCFILALAFVYGLPPGIYCAYYYPLGPFYVDNFLCLIRYRFFLRSHFLQVILRRFDWLSKNYAIA